MFILKQKKIKKIIIYYLSSSFFKKIKIKIKNIFKSYLMDKIINIYIYLKYNLYFL